MTALTEGLQDLHFCLMTGIEDLQAAMTAFFNADEPTEEQIGKVEDTTDLLINNLAKYRDAVGDEFPATEEDADSEWLLTIPLTNPQEHGDLLMSTKTFELFSGKNKVAEGDFRQIGSILKHHSEDGEYTIVGPTMWLDCARKDGIVGPLEDGIQSDLPEHIIAQMRQNRFGASDAFSR